MITIIVILTFTLISAFEESCSRVPHPTNKSADLSCDAPVLSAPEHKTESLEAAAEFIDFNLPVSDFVPTSDAVGNDLCRNHSRIFLQELKKFTLWAVQMYDSWAKAPQGVLNGHVYQLGHFDECLQVDVEMNGDDRIRGQYCLAQIKYKPTRDAYPRYYRKEAQILQLDYDPKRSAWDKIKHRGERSRERRDTLFWAFCIPSSCTHEDFQTSLQKGLDSLGTKYGVNFEVEMGKQMCTTNSVAPSTKGEIAFMCIFAALIALFLAGSIYDKSADAETQEDEDEKGVVHKILVSFSARRNISKLTTKKSEEHPLDIIHGMRCISMCCILAGHRFLFMFMEPKYDVQFVEHVYQYPISQIVLNTTSIVDTFFVMSGFLCGYYILEDLKNGKKFKFFWYVAHRLIRLWPVYLFTVALYATILSRIDNGPLWNREFVRWTDACAKNWWMNVFFLQNYLDVGNMCIQQTWYVACDFHYYLISPLVVLSLWKWPREGKILTGFLLVVSIIVPFVITYAGDLDITIMPYFSTLKEPFVDPTVQATYIKTHTRGSTFLMGIISGYITQSINWEKVKISKTSVIWMDISAFVFMLTIALSGYVFYQENEPCSVLLKATYAAVYRFCWSIPIVAFLLAMHVYKFPPIYKILSWKGFVPLSRLTYSFYIIHFIPILHGVGSRRTNADYRVLNMFKMSLNDVLISLVLAFLLNLLIESPAMELEKNFLKKYMDEEEPKKEATNGHLLQNNNQSNTNGELIKDK